MQRFLKLKSAVINTRHITKIVTYTDKHVIHLQQKDIGGIFSVVFGIISSTDDTIEVLNSQHSEDFSAISDFIKQI
jgi:hypothetical protein